LEKEGEADLITLEIRKFKPSKKDRLDQKRRDKEAKKNKIVEDNGDVKHKERKSKNH